MVDIGQASSSESMATLLYMRTCLMSAAPPQFLPETKVDTHRGITMRQVLQEIKTMCKTRNHIRRLSLVIMGLSLVWVMFAKLIVPPVIESAYRGESWPFLNRVIHGQAVHSVHFYLQLWDRMTIAGLVSS